MTKERELELELEAKEFLAKEVTIGITNADMIDNAAKAVAKDKEAELVEVLVDVQLGAVAITLISNDTKEETTVCYSFTELMAKYLMSLLA